MEKGDYIYNMLGLEMTLNHNCSLNRLTRL